MKSFFRKNRFKIGVVGLWIVSLSVFCYGIFSYYYQKSDFEGELKIEAKVEDEGNANIVKNSQELPDNQNGNISLEDDFVCPEDIEDPKALVREVAKQIRKSQDENPEMTLEDYMKKRYQQLLDHGCEKSIFNISVADFPNTFNFMGKDFGPKETDVNKETKVKTIFYPLKVQKSGEADENIIINFDVQGFWSEEPFTAEDVVLNAMKRSESEGYKVLSKFKDEGKNEKDATYLLTITRILPEKKIGSVFIEKFGTTLRGDVYNLSFAKNIKGEGAALQKEMDDWLSKNNKKYLGALNNFDLFAGTEEEIDDDQETEESEESEITLNNGIIELQQREK